MTARLHESAADRLEEIAKTLQKRGETKVTLKDLVAIIGRRAFATIILTFAIFNVLPLAIIPGVALITAIPILVAAYQLLIGRHYLWLPDFFKDKQLPIAQVVKVLKKSTPIIHKLEYVLRPRLSWMFSGYGIRFFAFVIFFMSFVLTLPVPFSNNIVGALLMLYALSLLEYDGLVFLVTLTLTIAYLSFIWHIGMYFIEMFS